MMYQIHSAPDAQGIDWYARDYRQLALPLPTLPTLAHGKKGSD